MAASSIEFLIHTSTVIVLALPAYLSYHVLKDVGGVIGSAFRYTIAGIAVISLPHFIEAMKYFGITLLEAEGLAHTVIEHAFISAGFLLIGYGFYELKNALKGN